MVTTTAFTIPEDVLDQYNIDIDLTESLLDITMETEDNNSQIEMTTLNPKYFPYDDQDIYELFLNYIDETEILVSVTESS